jgi:hypothetical protein
VAKSRNKASLAGMRRREIKIHVDVLARLATYARARGLKMGTAAAKILDERLPRPRPAGKL